MTHFRFIPLAVALTTASALIACTTAPAMPMGSPPASGTITPEGMAKMDAQMTMPNLHSASSNPERSYADSYRIAVPSNPEKRREVSLGDGEPRPFARSGPAGVPA